MIRAIFNYFTGVPTKTDWVRFYKKLLERQEGFTRHWILEHEELEKKFKAVCHENNQLRKKLEK